MENKDLESRIKEAELNKLKIETEKIKAEKDKVDIETKEIQKRLNKYKIYFQALVAAIISVPTFVFYYQQIIEPSVRADNIDLRLRNELAREELKIKSDSLKLAKTQFQLSKDTFTQKSREFDINIQKLSLLLSNFDLQNASLKTELAKTKEDKENMILKNTELLNEYERLKSIGCNTVINANKISEIKSVNQKLAREKEEIEAKIKNIDNSINFGILNSYKIGVYYDENDKMIGADIQEYLINNGFKGKLQLYPRDEDFFKEIGIPNGLEIRYEPSSEEDMANKLQSILRLHFKNSEFTLRPVKTKTPFFISIILAKKII